MREDSAGEEVGGGGKKKWCSRRGIADNETEAGGRRAGAPAETPKGGWNASWIMSFKLFVDEFPNTVAPALC